MKTNNLRTTLLAVVMLGSAMLASCEKDDGTTTQQPNTSIIGTKWQDGPMQSTWEDQQGNPHTVFENNIIYFDTKDEGRMVYNLEVPDMPEENETETIPFVYTYNAPNGTITATDQGITQTMTFFISENKLALTLGAEYYSLIFTQMTEK